MSKKPDPPVKKNGNCAVCDHHRPYLAVVIQDPFCSTECCRKYHEVYFGLPSATKTKK